MIASAIHCFLNSRRIHPWVEKRITQSDGDSLRNIRKNSSRVESPASEVVR